MAGGIVHATAQARESGPLCVADRWRALARLRKLNNVLRDLGQNTHLIVRVKVDARLVERGLKKLEDLSILAAAVSTATAAAAPPVSTATAPGAAPPVTAKIPAATSIIVVPPSLVPPPAEGAKVASPVSAPISAAASVSSATAAPVTSPPTTAPAVITTTPSSPPITSITPVVATASSSTTAAPALVGRDVLGDRCLCFSTISHLGSVFSLYGLLCAEISR